MSNAFIATANSDGKFLANHMEDFLFRVTTDTFTENEGNIELCGPHS